MNCTIKRGDIEVWLNHTEGRNFADLHVLICLEGVAVPLTPVELVELRNAIQGVLDAMGVEE